MDDPTSGHNGQGMPSFSYPPDPDSRVNDFYLLQEDPFSCVQPLLPSSTVLPPELDAASLPAPLSDYDELQELQELGDSTYGTNYGGQQWHPSQSLHGGTVSSMSTVGALAADMSYLQVPYAQSEAGVTTHRPSGRQKRRRLSRPATAVTLNSMLSSTAGPGPTNDAHSTGAASSHGEDTLAAFAVELVDGVMECTICRTKKKPRCDMIKHINTHTKPFKCSSPNCKHNQSPGGFATRSDLERHEITHTETRNLSQAYVCKHEKCRRKDRLWKRWDNLKTHLRDVHKITQPLKDEYLKKHNATHDQDLAGMGLHQFQGTPAAAPIVPGSFLEDFNSDIMVMEESNAPFQYPIPQENTKQYIDQLSQIVKNTTQGHKAPRVEMLHLGNANTTTVAPLAHYATPNTFFSNNQEQMGIYSADVHLQGASSGNSHMLQGMSAFMLQQPSDAPLQGGLPYQSMSRPSQSIVSLSPTYTSQATRSLNGTNQVLSSTIGQRPAPFSRHAVQPQPPRNDSRSMRMTTSSLASLAIQSQDTEMRDPSLTETSSVQSANRIEEIDTDMDVDADADADADVDVADVGIVSEMGEHEADESTHSKSVDGAGVVINISDDDDDPPDGQNETTSQPKSPTGHRVSFADPPSAAIHEPQVTLKNDKDDGDEEGIDLGVPNENISQPVGRPGATPTVGIDQLLHHLKNYSPQDIGKFLESINQMEALKNSGYEIRAPAQSSTHSRSVRSGQTGPSEEGSEGKKYPCPAEGCRAYFSSSSGLKKHEMRHTRPFGCTHGCKSHDKPQTFGSKNDWKRHEESFHFVKDLPTMTWQCQETTEDKKVCGQVFGKASIFQRHLADRHGIRDKTTKMAKCRLIPAKEARYWCGFCQQTLTDGTVTPSAAAAAATSASSSTASTTPTVPYSQLLTSRFNHIDSHFAGRNHRQASIDEWVTEEQHRQQMETLKSQSQPSPSLPTGSPKRPTLQDQPGDDDASRQDKLRSAGVLRICCRCNNMSAQINSESCNDCGVRFCENCRKF